MNTNLNVELLADNFLKYSHKIVWDGTYKGFLQYFRTKPNKISARVFKKCRRKVRELFSQNESV